MAFEEFTVQKDVGHVPLAQKDTPEGVLQEIERQALAQKVSATVETSKSEGAQKAAAGAAGPDRAEGKVLGDLAADAIGLKAISTMVDLVGTRLSDTRSIQGVTEQSATPAVTFEKDISLAGRAPGSYRNSAEAKPFGATQALSSSLDMSGVSLGDRVGLASASLRAEKDTGNLATWSQKPFENAKVGSLEGQVQALELQNNATLSKDVTFSKEHASEAALTSVKVAREHQSAMRGPQGPGMGMGPGGMNFDLSQGPRFNHAQYLGTEDTSGAA
jgi:hypothetical protein